LRALKILTIYINLLLIVSFSCSKASTDINIKSNIVIILSQLFNAQNTFKIDRRIDMNNDGIGEYGLIGELTGDKNIRNKYRVNHNVYLRRKVLTYVKNGIWRDGDVNVMMFLSNQEGWLFNDDALGAEISKENMKILGEDNYYAIAWSGENDLYILTCNGIIFKSKIKRTINNVTDIKIIINEITSNEVNNWEIIKKIEIYLPVKSGE